MRDYLLEVALRKADSVRTRVSEATMEPLREKAREAWRPYEPVEKKPRSFGAVDGSHNKVDFSGFTLYAVLGYGLKVVGSEAAEAMVGDVDILLPPGTGERIQLYREIAEARTAYLISRLDLLMIDGSIKALLIHPRPLARAGSLTAATQAIAEKMGEDFFQEYWEKIVASLEDMRRQNPIIDPLVSKKIIIENRLVGEEDSEKVALLEYLEKLMVLRRLLEENLDGKHRIVYVSKTSRSQLYFKDIKVEEDRSVPVVSDIFAFTVFTRKAGYSDPILESEVDRERRTVKSLPGEKGLDRIIKNFYMNIDIAYTFIRLVDDGPVLKLEIPFRRDTMGKRDIEYMVKRIMDSMLSLETHGYPYPLLEADKSSKITRGDMRIVAEAVGLLPTPTGREVLEEWF